LAGFYVILHVVAVWSAKILIS